MQENFLGRGGMFGLLLALTGAPLPGSRAVIAEGNMLRKGPVVFLLPQGVIDQVPIPSHRDHTLYRV